MNPNIKRILQESTYDVLGVKQVDQEKFSKLLIEECANICFQLQFTKEGPSDTAAYQRALCGFAIKENFGLQSKGPITALNIS
jgi:hypothetical protein